MARRCRECGAHLSQEGAGCPLCGEQGVPSSGNRETDVSAYQASVQELREQLRRLRRDAEAV